MSPRDWTISASAETSPQAFIATKAPAGEGRLTYSEAVLLAAAPDAHAALVALVARLDYMLNAEGRFAMCPLGVKARQQAQDWIATQITDEVNAARDAIAKGRA